MKIKTLIPALFAVGLICMSQVRSANAFFTTYVTAKGGYEVYYIRDTKLEEEFNNWNKYVKITNKEGSIPVYVRVKAFSGSMYSLLYAGEGWSYSETDGYYYYDQPLYGGETTKALKVFIDNIPVNPEEGDNFNVVVIYETIPIAYNEQNEVILPQNADWSETLTAASLSENANVQQEKSVSEIVIQEGEGQE